MLNQIHRETFIFDQLTEVADIGGENRDAVGGSEMRDPARTCR